MPVIAAEYRTARRHHVCANCDLLIAKGSRYATAYGYAHPGDKPYRIALHVECACDDTRAAIQRKEPK